MILTKTFTKIRLASSHDERLNFLNQLKSYLAPAGASSLEIEYEDNLSLGAKLNLKPIRYKESTYPFYAEISMQDAFQTGTALIGSETYVSVMFQIDGGNGKWSKDIIDLKDTNKVYQFLQKVPTKFYLEKNPHRGLNVRFRQTVPPRLTITKFEPEPLHEGLTWVDISGHVTADDSFQFHGQVEFSVDQNNKLMKIVDSSALDYVGEGYEAVILKDILKYARQYNMEGLHA